MNKQIELVPELELIGERSDELLTKWLNEIEAEIKQDPESLLPIKVYFSAARKFTDKVRGMVEKHGGKVVEYRTQLDKTKLS